MKKGFKLFFQQPELFFFQVECSRVIVRSSALLQVEKKMLMEALVLSPRGPHRLRG